MKLINCFERFDDFELICVRLRVSGCAGLSTAVWFDLRCELDEVGVSSGVEQICEKSWYRSEQLGSF